MGEIRAPSQQQLIQAREALLSLVLPYKWTAGEAPSLWTASAEALRRVEDALEQPHTVPNREGRRRAKDPLDTPTP